MKLIFLITIILIAPFCLFAQQGDIIDPCTDPDLPCPIDSNLLVLVTVAVLIAAKKAYSYKNYLTQLRSFTSVE